MIKKKADGRVFIANAGSPAARFQKSLLEVSVLDLNLQDMEANGVNPTFDTQDIVLIDLDIDETKGFATLDSVLRAQYCPKLLIMVFDTEIFQPSDRLGQSLFQILFKPFLPKDMISAVESLRLA